MNKLTEHSTFTSFRTGLFFILNIHLNVRYYYNSCFRKSLVIHDSIQVNQFKVYLEYAKDFAFTMETLATIESQYPQTKELIEQVLVIVFLLRNLQI